MEWNEKNDPPLPVSEVRTTIKSIERSHAGAERQFTSVDFKDDRNETHSDTTNTSTFGVMKLTD